MKRRGFLARMAAIPAALKATDVEVEGEGDECPNCRDSPSPGSVVADVGVVDNGPRYMPVPQARLVLVPCPECRAEAHAGVMRDLGVRWLPFGAALLFVAGCVDGPTAPADWEPPCVEVAVDRNWLYAPPCPDSIP